MQKFKWFKEGEKNWFRVFSEQNDIPFKDLTNKIFPNTSARRLQNLWQNRCAANGAYADALIWYSQANRNNWY
jgi:hypothetical protein